MCIRIIPVYSFSYTFDLCRCHYVFSVAFVFFPRSHSLVIVNYDIGAKMLCVPTGKVLDLKCLLLVLVLLLVKDQQQTEIWQHLVQVYGAHNGHFIIFFFYKKRKFEKQWSWTDALWMIDNFKQIENQKNNRFWWLANSLPLRFVFIFLLSLFAAVFFALF